MKQLSQKQLRKLLAKWQKILRLQDWTVTLRYGQASEFEDGVVASCAAQLQTKKALIRLSTYSDYHSRGLDPLQYNLEDDLVHELLHLHFTYLDQIEESKNPHYLVQLEQAIDAVQAALTRKEKN